jgi:hypothetical protein
MDAGEDLWADLDESSCLGLEECVESLIDEAPEGCLYCQLRGMEEDDE